LVGIVISSDKICIGGIQKFEQPIRGSNGRYPLDANGKSLKINL